VAHWELNGPCVVVDRGGAEDR